MASGRLTNGSGAGIIASLMRANALWASLPCSTSPTHALPAPGISRAAWSVLDLDVLSVEALDLNGGDGDDGLDAPQLGFGELYPQPGRTSGSGQVLQPHCDLACRPPLS